MPDRAAALEGAVRPPLTVSVVIPTHSAERWDDFTAAVASARDQTRPAIEVVVGVDHNDALLARIHRDLPTVRAVPNAGAPGASGTRNSAAASATGDLLVFFDDDAVARRDWLEALVAPLADAAVVGVGGRTDPLWSGAQPRWMPHEFLWVVACHYRGLPERSGPVRNVWSVNLAVRREEFLRAGGFLDGFGKVGNVSRPEDTEFCIRYAAALGGHWVYAVDARAGHRIGRSRETFGFFVRRCWYEGRGKAELAQIAGPADALSTERAYVRRVLPSGVVRGVRETVSGVDRSGVARSAAIIVGAGTAATGLMVDRVVRVVRARRPASPARA